MQAQRKRAHCVAAATLTGLVALAVTLYCFPPELFTFYPACPFHLYTGLLCPGCGATRALAALVHGEGAEAWRQNAMVLCLLPLALLYGAAAYVRALVGRVRAWVHMPRAAVLGLLALACGFSVVRNLLG